MRELNLVAVAGATHPGRPIVPNQDLIITAPDLAILLDGAGPGADEGGCIHGSAWFGRQLGGRLAVGAMSSSTPLADILAEAIEGVASLHRKTCDLGHPATPSAAVAVARRSVDMIDYLYLHSSHIVFTRRDGTPAVMSDHRMDSILAIQQLRADIQSLSLGSRKHRELYRAYRAAELEHRNTAGGYWVAGADPRAAGQAVTGRRSVTSLRSVSLFSDGIADYVERHPITTWSQVALALDWNGPASVISTVRAAEMGDPSGLRCPRFEKHSDASIVHWRLGRA